MSSMSDDINDACYDTFAFSSEITGMWLENVNVIDLSVSWRYLVDDGFCTR